MAMSSKEKANHLIWLQVYNKRLEVQHVPLTTLSAGLASICDICAGQYTDITPTELRLEEAHRNALRKDGGDAGNPTPVPICLPACGHFLHLGCALDNSHRSVEEDKNEKDETDLTCPFCRTAVGQMHRWKALLKLGILVVRK